MYSSSKPVGPYFPPAPSTVSANANYPFLAKPPKHKHKPQPITVRCLPTRTLPRPTSSRRRGSGSGSPASFIAFVDTPTPTPDTPKTPHLTTHGYTAAFTTLYHRRGSLPETPRSARRVSTSPKRSGARRSPPNSPKRGSPKRRQHCVPSPASPFASPSPTRTQQGRPRAKSTTTRIPIPSTPPPPPRTPKLSKIRSLTSLRSRSPSPAPPPPRAEKKMASHVSTPSSKRSKRSATPARGSDVYRPLPFIHQMELLQVLEGGKMEDHIRRHHIHAGQGTAHTGFAGSGYSFTDEQGMIWFDEEEEWEFACLLPRKMEPRRKRGIKGFLGKRRGHESEEEWEQFEEEEEPQGDGEVDVDALLARKDDELRAGQDDLVAFGGRLEGAWGRERPERSVLNLPKAKREGSSRRRRTHQVNGKPPSAPTPTPAAAPTTALKQEFLNTSFTPSPARTTPSPASSLTVPVTPARSASPFGRFAKHRHARSVPNAGLNVGEGQSFASLGSTMRGGSVLDVLVDVPPSPGMSVSFPRGFPDPLIRSMSPPPAAARRLGIDPSSVVSLQPAQGATKKSSFMNLRWRRD